MWLSYLFGIPRFSVFPFCLMKPASYQESQWLPLLVVLQSSWDQFALIISVASLTEVIRAPTFTIIVFLDESNRRWCWSLILNSGYGYEDFVTGLKRTCPGEVDVKENWVSRLCHTSHCCCLRGRLRWESTNAAWSLVVVS